MISQHDREFIRHPSDIPISVVMAGAFNQMSLALNNISKGGLAFTSDADLQLGSMVKIKIKSVKPVFIVKGIVAWCEPMGDYYDIGVEFIGTEDAYRVRMVEQVCHIEHYKRSVKEKEGRVVSGEKAAIEWITKYASTFPNPEP